MQVPKLKSTASVALNRKSKISIAIAMTAVALATRVSTCLQIAGRRSHSYGCSYSHNYNHNCVRGKYGRSSFGFIFSGKNECRNHEVISSSFSGWTAKSASTTSLYFSERDATNGSSSSNYSNYNNSNINIPALKKEVTRLSLRTHKKIGKASARLRGAQESLDRLRQEIMEQENNNDDDENSEQSEEILMQKLENAPTTQQMEEYQHELSELQSRLLKLNYLEEKLSSPPLHKKKILSMQDMERLLESESESTFQKIKSIIEELDISDDYENEKQKRVEMDLKNKQSKKQRAAGNNNGGGERGGENSGPRLPYRKYYSESNDLEIRVGKQATDNDVLSLSPEHRHPSHWWFHASGCPGSHVVLCTDAEYGTIVEDVMDAAALAAYKSKCYPGQSVIKVSMTHCRNVSKPPGAKAGLVQLNGEVRTVTLRKDEVERRWERLEKTVIVN